jgi:hypothetical protein
VYPLYSLLNARTNLYETFYFIIINKCSPVTGLSNFLLSSYPVTCRLLSLQRIAYTEISGKKSGVNERHLLHVTPRCGLTLYCISKVGLIDTTSLQKSSVVCNESKLHIYTFLNTSDNICFAETHASVAAWKAFVQCKREIQWLDCLVIYDCITLSGGYRMCPDKKLW